MHMVGLYNIYTDTEPPRARPGPPRPSSASGGPPAAARCGGVTNPTTEHRDAVGRSEAQLGVCIAHPGLSPGPINRRLRRRGQKLLLPPVHTFIVDSTDADVPHGRSRWILLGQQQHTLGVGKVVKKRAFIMRVIINSGNRQITMEKVGILSITRV